MWSRALKRSSSHDVPFGGKKEAIVFSREKTRIIFNLGIFSEYERTKVWSFVFLQARGIAFNHFLLFFKENSSLAYGQRS